MEIKENTISNQDNLMKKIKMILYTKEETNNTEEENTKIEEAMIINNNIQKLVSLLKLSETLHQGQMKIM